MDQKEIDQFEQSMDLFAKLVGYMLVGRIPKDNPEAFIRKEAKRYLDLFTSGDNRYVLEQ